MNKQEFTKQYLGNLPKFTAHAKKIAKQDYQEVLSLAVLAALKGLHTYKPGNFVGWFLVILRNAFINRYRKEVKRTVSAYPINEVDHPNTHMDPFHEQQLEYLMGKYLSPKEKDIVQLRLRGFKMREVAEQLGIPLNTIKVRIYKMRQRLNAENIRAQLV